MRFRAFLVASISAVALVSGGSAYAATPPPPTPVIYDVQVQQVLGSTMDANGGRVALVVALSRNSRICSYDFKEYDGYYQVWNELGTSATNSITDSIPSYELGGYLREYSVAANFCGGPEGMALRSVGFYPNSMNSLGNDSTFGGYTDVTDANAYGGEYQQVSGLKSRVTRHTGRVYSFGLYGETGPQGGIGTVYVNGTKAGTINFYSPAFGHYRTLLFKDGSETEQSAVFYVQMTGAGKGHGTTMYIDSFPENEYS
jgi:hypothetical protein